jgi:cobalt-precorrin-5B (C1)-methyltransferase
MKRKLKTGFTTGTAAAAAAKAALRYLLEGNMPSRVMIELLTGDKIAIPIHRCERTRMKPNARLSRMPVTIRM